MKIITIKPFTFSDNLKYEDEFDIDSAINEIYLLESSENLDNDEESYTINTGNRHNISR